MRIMSSVASSARALAVVLLVFSPSLLIAQTWAQVGERPQGMAGAFVAVADDASAVYWNPAGLATGSTFDAQVDVGRPQTNLTDPEPQRSAFVGAATPMLG